MAGPALKLKQRDFTSSTGAMASCDEVSNSDMTEAMESHTNSPEDVQVNSE